MPTITRRKFVERLPAATAGVFVLLSSRQSSANSAAQPRINFPTVPRQRLAVASYPFRAYIESPSNRDRNRKLPGMDLAEFASQVVTKFNVNNIEPHCRHFRSLNPEYLANFREVLAKANVKVVDIAVDGSSSFYDEDPTTRQKSVMYAKSWVDVAVAIGSPSIRTHMAQATNSSPDAQRAADSLRRVAEYGAERKVVINLENDDLRSEDAFFLVKVIESVANPYLRALPDFANSMLTGDASFNYRAVEAMFQHAYCICHVKDGETGDNQEFNIDMKRTFDILKSSAYRGYCSMEFDRAKGDPYAATARLIEQSLQYLR